MSHRVMRPNRRGLLGLVGVTCLAGACALALPRTASAQPIPEANGQGFDTHLFRPSMDSKGFFHTNGTDILGANDFSLGLVIDYGRNLLRVRDVGQSSPQLINHQFQGTFSFNYGIANMLVLGLSAPVNLASGEAQFDNQNPPQPTVNAGQWSPNAFDSQTLGFIAVHGKLRILRVERGFGLALATQVGVPVTDAPRSAGADPGFFIWPQLIGEKRFFGAGILKIGANAGFRAHSASGTQLDLRDGRFVDGQRITYGLGASVRVAEPVDIVADTYGTFLLGNADSAVKPSNEVTGGLKIFIERNSYLMLGAGPRYTSGFEAADVRAFVGFIFEPSIGDRDGDGIKDDLDKCPDEKEDFDGFEDEDGCPEPDNDHDGIPDIKDKCPNVPEDMDGDEDTDGCPEPPKDGDRDHDGIPDSRDKCPDDPEDKDGFEDEDGCPEPDNDHDGIPDVKDLCPNEPETFNKFRDEDGCPDRGNVVVEDNNIVILKKIQFKTGSAEILPESNEILDAVSGTIKDHPEFQLVEVAGHADERAPDAYNLQLTQLRVNAVVAALVARGTPANKLRSKGYGEYCPEDPEHNEAAWEKNRRVEFKIVKTADGPTGVELGCKNALEKGVKPDPVP
ncbi:MAG: OmpA family protein [Myxococcales bacterium]|nr:OmpA family protein [Myxococcales bacterium]